MKVFGYFFLKDNNENINSVQVFNGEQIQDEETIDNLISTAENLNSDLTGYMYMIIR